MAQGLLSPIWFLHAQDEGEDDEDIFRLSPFTVVAQDEGYFATETLAGTRLKTDVRNLGASITVITEEMMNDLGANTLEELLPYVANTESGGLFGNYSGEGTVDFFGQGTPSTFVRMRPQAQTRVRGLSEADLTRNFLLSDVPVDGYNIERIAVQRGANAMLFGLGSPAGLLNFQLLQARFTDTNHIEYQTDQYGTNRVVLDLNRQLVEDKLAARIAFLYEDKEYNQEPTFEEDRRIYGAFTYKPFETTTLRVNLEAGEIDSSRPDPIGPLNNINRQWFDAGMPLATQEMYNDPAAPTFPFGAGSAFANGGGVATIFAGPNAEPNSQLGYGITRFIGPRDIAPLGDDAIDPDANTLPWKFLSTGNYRGQNMGGGGDGNDPRGQHARSEEQGFLNFDILDFEDLKVHANELGNEKFESTQITLEQLFLRESDMMSAGIEFTYMTEDYDNQFFDNQWDGISSGIFVDVNPILPDGSANPNVGRPGTFNLNPREQVFNESQEARRVTAFYELDFTNSDDMRWAGRHTLTGLLNKQESTFYNHEAPWNLSPVSDNPDHNRAFDRRFGILGFGTHPTILSYIGPSVLGAQRYEDIQITDHENTRIYIPGETLNYQVWDNDTQQFLNIPAMVGGPGRPRKAQSARNENDSVAAILHSEFFEGNIVTTLGWREDDVDLFVLSPVVRDSAGLVDVSTINPPQLSFIDNNSDSITSWGVVAKWPEQWMELPNFLDAFSIYYSESENFDPTPGRIGVDGSALPTPSGTTEEYGFRFSTLQNKLHVRVNFFETALTNADASTPIGNPEVIGENNILNRVGDYLAEAELQFNQGNEEMSDQLVGMAEQILSIATPGILAAESFRRDSRFEVTFSDPGNQAYLADRVSDGLEIEVFGNPIEGLHLGFNASKQEVVQTNLAPRAIALFNELEPKWRAIGDFPTDPVDVVLGTPNPNTIDDAIDDLASKIEQTKNLDGVPAPEIREWRWNLFADYDFPDEGALSNFGIGGALRWQDEGVIGHQSMPFSGPDGQQLLTADLDNPITVDSLLQGDIWFRYNVPFFENVDWKIQLNIRNALRDEDVIGVRAQPDSPDTDIAQVRLTQPTTFILRSTWDF